MAAVLTGLGTFTPPTVLTNEQMCERLDVSPSWIESRTGIRERRVVDIGYSTGDLAVEAGARALKSANLQTVDALVLVTTAPERIVPAGAPEVASRLGLGSPAAFDLSAACSGFVYGLAVSKGLIESQVADTVLMIAAEAFSLFVDNSDPNTAPLFGDGAGAVVLRRGDSESLGAIGSCHLGSDGGNADFLALEGGGARQRSADGGLGHAERDRSAWYVTMQGRPLARHAIERMSASILELLDGVNRSSKDVDLFLVHQANLRIVHAVAAELDIPLEKFCVNVDTVGNTLSASIPLALAEASSRGMLKTGDFLVLAAFGAGLSWGSTSLTWPDIDVCSQPI